MRPPLRAPMRAALLTLSLVAWMGCGRDRDPSNELQDQHREILSRLADLERKIDRLASRPGSQAQRAMGPDANRTYSLPVERSAVKGPDDAPITIVEFADYQCPYCARSEAMIEEALAAYPTQARFVFKHFPLTSSHPQAMPAALAAVAAQRQGKFWEMHEVLFANQRALSNEQLLEYARKLGLDMKRFEADMASDEVKSQVEEDRRLARRAGVRGTPTVFVNGRLLQNRSLDGFKQLIEPILAQAASRTARPKPTDR